MADFAMVSGLLMLIFAMVFQLGLTLHVRNTLISCAAEGARLGARADAQPGDGVARARDLIGLSLSSRFAQDVTASTSAVDGVAVVVIRVQAPLPLIGPFGPSEGLDVVGRAFQERQ
ncbi:MAG: TadE family protein [Tetrasphaera sp.]